MMMQKINIQEHNIHAYGKYLYDNLSVACYWLKKYDEATKLLESIIDDPEFSEHKERLERNLVFSRNGSENI